MPVVTPIKLVSWGHLEQLSHLISQGRFELGILKADQEAAYRKLPIDPAGQQFAIIALRRPKSGHRFGFSTRALISGAVAAVLRYNVFSKMVATVVNRAFGIPMVCYFGDFAALVKLCLVKPPLDLFSRCFLLFGIGLKPGKSAAGHSTPFFGIARILPELRQRFPA